MHSLGHLMTSEGERQFVLIVFLLGQFVIPTTSATRFRNSGSPVKVPEEQTGSRCSHLIHILKCRHNHVHHRHLRLALRFQVLDNGTLSLDDASRFSTCPDGLPRLGRSPMRRWHKSQSKQYEKTIFRNSCRNRRILVQSHP